MDPLIKNLLSPLVATAGTAALNRPDIQGAIANAQGQITYLRNVSRVAAVAGTLVFVFYFVPRFRAPWSRAT